MLNQLFLMPLAALFQGVAAPEALPQDPERKVRIEIVTTENGETKRVTKEFDATDEAQIHDALKELGVMDHLRVDGDGENVTIDIRRFGPNDDSDLSLSLAPVPPVPPVPPIAPLTSFSQHGFLGVNARELNASLRKEKKIGTRTGAYITSVVEDTPAANAGLQEGDVITAVDNEAISGPADLTEAIRAHDPGDEVNITYYRNDKKNTVKVELQERKHSSYHFEFGPEHGTEEWDWENYLGDTAWEADEQAFLGVTPGEGDGAVIGSVVDGSSAETMGIQAGDVIEQVNGEKIPDFPALSKAIKSKEPGDEVRIVLQRNGAEKTVTGTLGEHEGHRFFGSGAHGFRFEGLAPEDRDELRREMDALRREMDEMRHELGKGLRREVRVTIETMPLNDTEKDLLKRNGVAGLDKELDLGGLRCFPNPSNGFFRLQFDVAEKGDLRVDVHDATGAAVYQERITAFKGRYERTLDLTDRATGNYFLVISQNGRTSTQKLVKE